jgi:hypothetical protein
MVRRLSFLPIIGGIIKKLQRERIWGQEERVVVVLAALTTSIFLSNPLEKEIRDK